MYNKNHIGQSSNDILINSIEINALVKLLESKGLIAGEEYSSILRNVGTELLSEAESKGMVDKRMVNHLLQKLYE